MNSIEQLLGSLAVGAIGGIAGSWVKGRAERVHQLRSEKLAAAQEFLEAAAGGIAEVIAMVEHPSEVGDILESELLRWRDTVQSRRELVTRKLARVEILFGLRHGAANCASELTLDFGCAFTHIQDMIDEQEHSRETAFEYLVTLDLKNLRRGYSEFAELAGRDVRFTPLWRSYERLQARRRKQRFHKQERKRKAQIATSGDEF